MTQVAGLSPDLAGNPVTGTDLDRPLLYTGAALVRRDLQSSVSAASTEQSEENVA